MHALLFFGDASTIKQKEGNNRDEEETSYSPKSLTSSHFSIKYVIL